MALSQVISITTILLASAYSMPQQTEASDDVLNSGDTFNVKYVRHYSWWPPMSPLADIPPVFEIITTPAPSVSGSSDTGVSVSHTFPSGPYFTMLVKPPSGTLAMPAADESSNPPAAITSKPSSSDMPANPSSDKPPSEMPVKPSFTIPAKPSSDLPVKPSLTIPAKPSADIPVKPSFTIPAKPPSDMPVKPSFTIPANPSAALPVKPSFTIPAKPPSDMPVKPSFTIPAKPPSDQVLTTVTVTTSTRPLTVTPTGPPSFSLVEECFNELSINYTGVNPWQIYYNKPKSSLSIEERKIHDQLERCVATRKKEFYEFKK